MTTHRQAFRAALADGKVCTCPPGSCLISGPGPLCPLCTADFAPEHPCPGEYPDAYYAHGDDGALVDGEISTVRGAVVRYGQCSCPDDRCAVPDCPLCSSIPHPYCLRGLQVKLNAGENMMRLGYASGELPCPHGGESCSTADGRWYHGDCKPSGRHAMSPLAQSLLHGVAGGSFTCDQHGTHPHTGLTCARCPVCLAISPDAINAAHDYSHVAVSPDSAETRLAQHLDRLAEALGIVGAEDDIDMYGAVESLHKEIDRMREVFGRVSYVLQVALNPHASSASFASPAEQPWNGARKALELVQEEVNNAAGKGKPDVVG